MINTIVEVYFSSTSWERDAAEDILERMANIVDGEVDSFTSPYEDEWEAEIFTDDDTEDVEIALTDFIDRFEGIRIYVYNAQ